MTEEFKKRALKKAKIAAGIPDSVTVYDERISDLIDDAVIEMRTGGVPQSVIDEGAAPVISCIAHYVCYELRGDTGETKDANWHLGKFERKVFRLSLEQPGATMEGLL